MNPKKISEARISELETISEVRISELLNSAFMALTHSDFTDSLPVQT
jgi:hypothetical protein